MAERTIRPHGRIIPLRGGDTLWGRQRRALGLSLREVELRTGINRGMLSQIERGIEPTFEQAAVLVSLYAALQSEQSDAQPAG